MSGFYEDLSALAGEGQTVALATIIHTTGSVPREVGARMVVHPGGHHRGTVGGGCGEAEVIRAGLDVIDERRAVIVRVDLTGEITLGGDGICGGTMDVLVEPWPPVDEPASLWSAQLAALQEHDRTGQHAMAWLTRLPPAPVRHAVRRDDGTTIGELPSDLVDQADRMLQERRSGILITAADESWFMEVQRRPPQLLIVGAGHIAVPLAKMASLLDFRVTVLDDRASFANRERFPDAGRIICDHYDRALREFPIDADTYIVLVTRGHQHDVESLLAVLDSPAAYVGMIGSRRRVRGVFELLERERGIPPHKLRRVYSPIGLHIGAVTPAEIAISILAEVVKVFRHGTAASLSDDRRQDPAGKSLSDRYIVHT